MKGPFGDIKNLTKCLKHISKHKLLERTLIVHSGATLYTYDRILKVTLYLAELNFCTGDELLSTEFSASCFSNVHNLL